MFKTKIALLALSLAVALPAIAPASMAAQKSAPFACPVGDSKDTNGQCVPYDNGSGSGAEQPHGHHSFNGR